MPSILTFTLNPALDLATTTPEVVPGPKLRCAEPRRDPGGGGVNVSRVLARLGHRSVPLVALGGATGMAVRGLLEAEGLAPDVIEVPEATRQSLSVTDAEGRQFRFILPGAAWQGDTLAGCITALAERIGEGDIVVLSGSLPPGVPAGLVEDLCGLCADLGARAVIDVSADALEAAAGMRGPGAWVLRMDGPEAGMLLGDGKDEPDAAEAEALARRLVAQGAAAIVSIALGAEGSVVADAGGAVRTVPPRVRVDSTTGAGDSYLAGLVAALAEGRPLDDAAAFATACAADAVTTPATDLCTPEGVARLLPEVRVHRL